MFFLLFTQGLLSTRYKRILFHGQYGVKLKALKRFEVIHYSVLVYDINTEHFNSEFVGNNKPYLILQIINASVWLSGV